MGNGETSQSRFEVLTLDYYRPYFDVSTEEFLERLKYSILPTGT